MEFFLKCVPPKTSHHHKRIVRLGKFSRLADKPELVAAKETLDALLLPHVPPTPVTGPVWLGLEFTWPWLKGDSQRVRAAGLVPHDRKPDLDNLCKTLTDRLTVLRFIEADGCVVRLSAAKYRGAVAGIRVAITESPR